MDMDLPHFMKWVRTWEFIFFVGLCITGIAIGA